MDGTNDKQNIAAYLSGDAFARVFKDTPTLTTLAERRKYMKRAGGFAVPVAAFKPALRARGAPPVLLISRDTIGHIKFKRPWITPLHLRVVQTAVDGAHTHHQKDNRWMSFAEDDDGQWWAAPWKVTEGGARAYQTTLIDLSERKVERANRRYRRR